MWLLIPCTVILLIYSLVIEDKELTLISLTLVGSSAVVAILQWCLATRARCPLCHARSIAQNGCSKHRTAKRAFGSYRLRVASSIIFRQSFRCPYCGESTAMQTRASPQQRRKYY